MSRLLLIETATEVCSVALSVDGMVVAEQTDEQCSSHAAVLTLQIEAVVQAAGTTLRDLDAVAVSSGPGSYTSLRVGASVAKGLCYALDLPLLAVDTLEALAHAAAAADSGESDALHLPMLDARRNEVWLAAYRADGQCVAPAQPLVLDNNSFENWLTELIPNPEHLRLIVSGNGANKFFSAPNLKNAEISAVKKCAATHLQALAEKKWRLQQTESVAYFEPLYMKPPNITVSSKVPF
jgi:tRNA threonylcarbamoyladenosine biosynthesis protein TsaB